MRAGVVLKLDADAGTGSELVIAQVAANVVFVGERAMHDAEIDFDVDRSRTIALPALWFGLLFGLWFGLVLLFR